MKFNELVKRVISSVIIIPIVILLVYLGSYYFILFLFLCFTIATYEWTKIAKLKNYLIPGFIFIGLSFISAYNTRYITFYDYEGVLTFLFILLICILTDIGGYVFGKTLKGPKLTRISPNKTNAGGGAPTVINTANNINQASDTFFTQNPSTRNNESTLQRATRQGFSAADDDI